MGNVFCTLFVMPSTNPYETPFDYQVQRVKTAVTRSLNALNAYNTDISLLDYLAVDSWDEIVTYFEQKRTRWNETNPTRPMTLTNSQIDHIKPTSSFKNKSLGMKMYLSNHYTNLQLLLQDDNQWKGSHWSSEDELIWKTKIALQQFNHVYFPCNVFQPSLEKTAFNHM